MATLPDQPRYSPEEYLVLEREAEYKSEYIDGHIVAMTGASLEHNLITMNAGGELRALLKARPCQVYSNDMRVKVVRNKKTLYTYPDVVVVCGKPQVEDRQLDTLLNPTVIIEVLSDSTERYDRGEKFSRYRDIASLQEYLLISQHAILVEHYVRQGEQWLFSDVRCIGDAVELPSIGCRLPINEIYDKVDISAWGEEPERRK